MSKARICFVVASPLTAKVFLIGHLNALSNKFSVDLVCNADSSAVLESLIGEVNIIPVAIQRTIQPMADLRALLKLHSLFKSNQYDVICSVTPKAGLLSMLAAFFSRVQIRIHIFTGQVWVTRRGVKRWLLKAVDKLMALLATDLLTDSPSQRSFLVSEGVVPPTKIKVLADGSISGVDVVRFSPKKSVRHAVRQELEIPEDADVLLFLGRITRDKGVLDLAHAYAGLATRYRNLWLLVVGPDEGCFVAEVEKICAEHSARMRIIGFTEQPERFMVAADVFVLPSYREGFGSSVIEAAACGLPTVCSRIYGLTDAVIDGATGILHAPADVADLEEKIEQILDPVLRERLGLAARERVMGKFGQQRLTDEMIAFIRLRIDQYHKIR